MAVLNHGTGILSFAGIPRVAVYPVPSRSLTIAEFQPKTEFKSKPNRKHQATAEQAKIRSLTQHDRGGRISVPDAVFPIQIQLPKKHQRPSQIAVYSFLDWMPLTSAVVMTICAVTKKQKSN